MAKKINAQLNRKRKSTAPMPSNDKLVKDLTRYGDRIIHLSDVLYYASERTVEQYKKMRMHPMCWLGLQFLKLGLSNIPFNVVYKEDEDIRLIAEKMLQRVWRRMIRDAFEKLDFGFKCMEIRYEYGSLKYRDEKDKEKVYTGHLFKQPRALDGETIEIVIEPGVGRLRGFRQDYTDDRLCLVDERKALIFTHNLESGNFYGTSALEPAFPYWYDANLNRQFHMRWLERKGTGFFKGFYPEGETETDSGVQDNQEIMLDLLDSIMEGNAIALPSDRNEETGELDWNIEFMSTEEMTDPFIERANYIDEMILKALVIPEKALTQGEVGARASIESFQDMFIQRKQDILDDTVDTIDKYFLPHFIELNFGADLDIHVEPGKLDDTSKSTAAMIVEKLLEQRRINIDIPWLETKTGIPIEEKEVQEIPEQFKNPNEIKPNEEETNERSGETQKAGEPKKGEKEEKEGKKEKEELADVNGRWRAFSKWDNQYNLSDLEAAIDTRKTQFVEDLTTELDSQFTRIKRYLDKTYNADGKSADVAKGVLIKRSPIRKLLKGYLGDIYKYSFEKMQAGVEGKYKFASTDSSNKMIGFRVGVTANKFATDLESELQYTINDGLSSLKSKPEMQDDLNLKIQKFLSTRLGNVAETELGFVLGKGVEDYISYNNKQVMKGLLDEKLEVMRVRYSAILDRHVCDYCRELDGLVTSVDSGVYRRYDTPAHYMCRCVWLPITRAEIENMNVLGTDISVNADGKPVTISDILSGKKFTVYGEGGLEDRKVGGKLVDLRTFSDPGNHMEIPIIRFYKEKETIVEKKEPNNTTIPIEVKIDMTDNKKDTPTKKIIKVVRDEKGNLSGGEIEEV